MFALARMEESRSAVDLGEDIWHVINNLLLQESPSSLLALRLTSRSYKVYVDPVLNRRLELSYEGREINSAEQNVQRLLDPSDDLLLHVQDLVISYPKPSTISARQKKRRNGFLLGYLESVIDRLHRLKSFSWTIRWPIPEAIIAKLENGWPDAILNMYAHDLPITGTRSLYSPLLRSLSFCLPITEDTFREPRKLEQRSKLPELREALLRSPSLRKLDVKFVDRIFLIGYEKSSGIIASPHLLHLPLQPGDRLPPLQELVLSGPPETYEFTLEHCQLWKNCMDWSHLRRLDLGISCPQYFFEQLGDRLTSLTALSMGVRIGARDSTPWTKEGPLACDSVLSIGTFLGSILRLEELTITSFHSCTVDFFHEIFDKHSSLRKFYYHMSTHRSGTTFASTSRVLVLDMLPFTLPELRELTIDFPLVRGRWPEEHTNTLAKLFRLDTLKVFVELDGRASVFAAKHVVNPGHHTPPFKFEAAEKVATDLFKSFFAHNPYACLTSLEVFFLRVWCDGEQHRHEMKSTIRIKRLQRDDAPSPLDGGFVVDSDNGWMTMGRGNTDPFKSSVREENL